jgi:two-component sensor histidine kinase
LDASKEWLTTIRALIDSIFAPYLNTDGRRLSVNGPDLQIQQRSITALALVLYELATNAVKYGSLSLPTGTVQIELALANANLDFVWKERGGPKLIETPSRDGFGTSLVRAVLSLINLAERSRTTGIPRGLLFVCLCLQHKFC